MKNLTYVSAAIFLLSTLEGCMAVDDYMAIPESDLCMQHLTYPSYNVNQGARAQAISARAINCAPYGAAAQARIQADQNFENALRLMGGQEAHTGYHPVLNCIHQAEYISGLNKICIYDCAGSKKTTNISPGAVCPSQAQF